MYKRQGYRSLKEVRRSGEKLQAGDKVYVSSMGKTLALFHIGKEPMEKGMNILGAHIDSPRLDLKQNPLYELSLIHICFELWNMMEQRIAVSCKKAEKKSCRL